MFSCRREFPGVATVHTANNRLRALSSSSSDSGLGQSEKIYEFMETYYNTYLSLYMYVSIFIFYLLFFPKIIIYVG